MQLSSDWGWFDYYLDVRYVYRPGYNDAGLDGTFLGPERIGNAFRVHMLDASGAAIGAALMTGAAYGERHKTASFTNSSDEAATFFLRVRDNLDGATWELIDYSLTVSLRAE